AATAAEVGAVLVGDDRDHAAAHRYAGLVREARVRPGLPEDRDLLGLELVEGDARVLEQQRRAHEVHALLAGPARAVSAARPPPDSLVETRRLRLNSQPAGGAGHGRIRLGDARAGDRGPEQSGLLAGQVGVAAVLGRDVAERVGAVAGRLRRAAADPELEAPAGDQIGR